MHDEKLIELVRDYVELYDNSNPKYMDPGFKDKIWREIGEQMGQPSAQCKKRWSNIRDCFRKSIKKAATRYSQGADNIRKYKYDDQLEFLKHFLQEKDTSSSVPSEEGTIIFKIPVEEQEQHDEETETWENPFNKIENNRNDSIVLEPLQTPSNNSEQINFTGRGNKRKYEVLETAETTLMKFISDKNESQLKYQPTIDTVVDSFLSAIAPTLKFLTPYYLNLAKTDIFATVQKYEMEQILGGRNTMHSVTTTTTASQGGQNFPLQFSSSPNPPPIHVSSTFSSHSAAFPTSSFTNAISGHHESDDSSGTACYSQPVRHCSTVHATAGSPIIIVPKTAPVTSSDSRDSSD